MTTIQLLEQGFASYKELKEAGIKRTIDLGRNDWGFNERIIELNDDSQWDYIPEDRIYELRTERYSVSITNF